MPVTDDILWLLKDGKWYPLEDIAEKVGISRIKTETVIKFLSEYNFIQLSKNNEKAKLQTPTQLFIKKIIQLEQETMLNP